jgi:dolichol-phosphate mannosyltransferase
MSESPRPLADSASALPGTWRLALTGLAGPLVDLAAFWLLLASGMAVVPAQLASFAMGLAVSYMTALRPALRNRDATVTGWPHGWLLFTALAAVLLRSGALGLTLKWGWPAQLGILPALLSGMAVMAAGRALLLSPVALPREARLQHLAVGVMAYSFVLRLLYAGQVELLPEEAYYWNYSQHPALGYLDHPPMVAWLISLGTSIAGNTELGIRIGPLLTQALATFFAWRMTRELFGAASAFVAVILMQVLPFFFLAGLITTPDAPLTAAWAGCLYFLQRALLQDRPGAWWGVGLCLGLGLVSKYTIGLLVPSALLFAVLDRQARHWLWSWRPWVAGLLAAAIFSPVLIWNAQHEWASFVFQTSRRLEERTKFALHQLLLSILVLITPTGLLSLPVILRRQPAVAVPDEEAAQAHRRQRFIRVFVLVPLAVYTLFSLRHEVKLDWTGTLWLAAVPALAAWLASTGLRANGARSRLHAAWAPTGAVTLVLLGLYLDHLALGLPGVGDAPQMELLPVGWRELGTRINAVAAGLPAENGIRPLVVGMERYVLASEIAFYAPDHRVSVANTGSVNLFGPMGIMYERWFPPQAQRGRTLVLVAFKVEELTAARTAERVASLEPVQTITLTRGGAPFRTVYYRIAHGYRPPTLESPLPN